MSMGELGQWFEAPASAVPGPLEGDLATQGQTQLSYLPEGLDHSSRTLPPFLQSLEIAWSISLDGRVLPSTPRSARQGPVDGRTWVVLNLLLNLVHRGPEFEVILFCDSDDADVIELGCNLA